MNDKLTIDLTNFKDRVGSRVAPGTYRVIVEDAEQDKSKAGNPMVNIWFKVQGGDFDGATITDRLVLTEKSLFRVVGFMQAIGLPTPKKRLQISLGKFLNQVLEIEVSDGEPYNGRVRSEVRGYARVKKSEKASGADLDDLENVEEPETTDPAESEGADEFKAETTSNPSEPKAQKEDSDSQGEVDLDDLTDL